MASGKVFAIILFLCYSAIFVQIKCDDDDVEIIWPELIDRDKWGGCQPKYTIPLSHPIRLVIISHTATKFCSTLNACSSSLKSIQSYHNRDSTDIGYNFLIGGDGNVYVGRGWDVQNFHTHHQNDTIGISFIGNYMHDKLPELMAESAHALLDEGIKLGKIDANYKVIGHNQIKSTLSPGINVINVIKQWPHFNDGKF